MRYSHLTELTVKFFQKEYTNTNVRMMIIKMEQLQ